MLRTSDSRESVWAEHESVIRRFEEAWADGRPDLAGYLATQVRDRGVLLLELAQIDLEFRFRGGERPRVEEYLSRFPELNSEPVLTALLASELSLRNRHGQPYSVDELRNRFPQLATRLDTLLLSGSNRERTRTRAGGGGKWVTAKPVLSGYTLGEQLGRGGMGVVYRAEQSSPVRTVAVKTLLTVPTERTAARFRREAEAMARLDHPNIVPVYEVGEWMTGDTRMPYFTMKWYSGGSLDSARCGPGTAVADHARTVETIARAVHHAHQRGVLHRDLKPSNILLDADGRPAVADFGLAGWLDPDSPPTLSESIVGTPAFMAPEQAKDPSGVTTASDVYGLGAILYHQLTGRPPINATTAIAALGQLGVAAPDRPSAINPAIPRDLETVCLKCLETDSRNRYPHAEAVADDLARWRNGESISARRPGVWERVWRTVRRHPVVTGLSFATATALVVTLVTLSVSVERIRQKETETAAALEREKHALYLERVAAVGRLYQSNHLEQAWYTLNLCPVEWRQWEWQYLDRLRRDSGGIKLTHRDAVVSAAFLSDGRVVTAERGGEITIWGGKKTLPDDVQGTALRTHRTRNLLAVQGGRKVKVVDLERGEVVLEMASDGWVDFTPDGKLFVVAEKGVVKLFNTDDWEPAGELNGHKEIVWSGVFSPDGTTLYTGSSDLSVAVWDWKAREVRTRWKRDLAVMQLSIAADGKTLFETQPSRLMVTDTATGTTRRMTDVSGGRPVFLPTSDPTLFVTGNTTGELLFRTAEPGEPIRVYRGHAGFLNAISVSTDGKSAVTAGEDGTARVWDLSTSPEYTDLAAPPSRFSAPALSADGQRLALVSRNPHNSREYALPVLDAATGRELYRTKGTGDAAFDPKGRWLATGSVDGAVILRDPTDGTEQKVLKAGTRGSVQIRFSGDGTKLVAAEILGPVRVWDTTTWEVTEYTPVEEKRVAGLAVSSDGRLALAEGDDVVIWGPASGVERRIRPASVPLVCLFSPDDQTLAIAGRGRTLELYDVATGRRQQECIGNPSVVNGLAFHPSGTRLASVGVNGFARVWDTGSGKEVLTLKAGTDLFGVAWSSDGTHLFAAGSTVRRWSSE